MNLVDIDSCNKELFYEQMGGKDNLITAEAAFNMLMALPVVTENEIYNEALEDFSQGLRDYVYEEKLKGKEPYWTVAIDNVKNKLLKCCFIWRGRRE